MKPLHHCCPHRLPSPRGGGIAAESPSVACRHRPADLHPQPATRAANVQTKEQIAQLQQRAQQAQQQYHAANASYEQAVQLQQHYEERCNSLDIQMATASSLQQLVAEHRALVAQTAAHQDTSAKLLQKLDNGKIKFAQEQHNEKEQVTALQQLQTDKRVAEQALADIIARLPSHTENAAMLQQQLELKQQNYHTLMQEWQRMEQSYEKADRQYEFAVKQITATELQLDRGQMMLTAGNEINREFTRLDEHIVSANINDKHQSIS